MIRAIYAINRSGWFGNYDEKTSQFSLPWSCPEDLQHFKATTTNSIIIMGAGTYQSIGRALPKRTNIVITSRPQIITDPNIKTFKTPEEALEYVGYWDAYVIGGQILLESMKTKIDEIILSRIEDYTEANIPAPDMGLDGSYFERISTEQKTNFTLEVYRKTNDNKD